MLAIRGDFLLIVLIQTKSMKKIIVLLISIMAVAFSAKAQMGVVAGLTSSSVGMKDAYQDAKNINLYHVGIAYKFDVAGIFAVQPALIYNVKGAKLGSTLTPDVLFEETDFKTGFLELPVQLQLGVPFGKYFRVYGLAEPFVGYAITNECTLPAGVTLSDRWANVRQRFEYGMGLGAGFELFKRVQISAKYFWNMGKLYGASDEVNMSEIVNRIADNVSNGQCSGVSLSAYIFF